MAEPTTATGEPAPHAGFAEEVRFFLASLAGYFHARLSLAGVEAKEAAFHYVKMGALLGAAAFGLVFGYVFFIAGAVMAVAYYSAWPVRWVLLGAALLHFILTVVAVLIAWAMFSVPQFEATLAEFQKDREWLK